MQRVEIWKQPDPVEGVIHYTRRKGKVRRVRLYSVKRILADPIDANYSTQIEIFVPKPNLEYLLPIIFVFIQNGRGKLFFRVRTTGELEALFGALHEQEIRGLNEAIERARVLGLELAQVRKEVELLI